MCGVAVKVLRLQSFTPCPYHQDTKTQRHEVLYSIFSHRLHGFPQILIYDSPEKSRLGPVLGPIFRFAPCIELHFVID